MPTQLPHELLRGVDSLLAEDRVENVKCAEVAKEGLKARLLDFPSLPAYQCRFSMYLPSI